LDLYTDTGGGLFIFGDVVDHLRWPDSAGVAVRDVVIDDHFPEPLGAPDHRIPIWRPADGRPREYDGMLGQAWFADRVWTFDYASEKLLLHRGTPEVTPETRTVDLGFLADSTGARQLSFPRITVVVDGDSLHLLFDTGATIHLTAAALDALGDSDRAVRATSFITSERLNRWRSRHPEWRVIPDADETVPGMALIEVPEVSVADFKVGPVWFTERPDANFHEFMSQWMDRRVDGALGGNFLRYFRVTVDYPSAVVYLVPPGGSG
jgi:hypothetical protein